MSDDIGAASVGITNEDLARVAKHLTRAKYSTIVEGDITVTEINVPFGSVFKLASMFFAANVILLVLLGLLFKLLTLTFGAGAVFRLIMWPFSA